MRTQRRFYRRTRPFGFWQPYWAELSAEDQAAFRREHRNDQAALPFALLAQVTLFMLPMQFVLHAFGAFLKTLPFFLIGTGGMYRFWWRNLPAGEASAEEAPAERPALPETDATSA